jgi:TonB-linked SusC/RagA family outer membrane protein
MTGQFNGSYQIKDWFNIGVTNSIETSKIKQISESSVLYSSITSMVFLIDPLTPVEYSDGLTGASAVLQDGVQRGYSPVINPKTGNYYGISRWSGNTNPLASLEIPNVYTDAFQINGTLYANLTPVKNLVITSRLGYRFNNTYTYRYEKPNWNNSAVGSTKPYLATTQLGSKYYQLENFANYNLKLGKNDFTVMAGTSYIKSVANYMSSSTDELQSMADNYHYLNYSTTTANDIIGGNTTEKVQIAYYGRLTWNYADRYNLQFNFRADSYDAAYLDLQHNWGYFPSVSAGWTVTNESFMQNRNRDILSSLKLRASYGKNGSISNLGGYMYASNLNAGALSQTETYNYYMNSKLYTGIYPSLYLANPKLRWEESKQIDAGIDVRLFKDKLNLTVDYFDKNTDGLLVQSSANLTTGTNFVFQNVGVVNNHGFEFDLEWKDAIKKVVKYGIKANLATVSNNVDKYKGAGIRIAGSSLAHAATPITYFEEGYPIWYLRGYKVDHLDPTNGKPIYKDLNTDGQITEADKAYMGSGIPDFTYGATLSLSYKNFDVLVNGAGAFGNQIFYGIARTNGLLQNRAQFLYDGRWTPENTNAKYAAPFYSLDANYLQSDAFVFNGSYFKIKQLQLGYNLPKKALRLIDASEMRIYVSVDDFFTFTKYPGSDPEVRPNSTTSMAIDFGGYPVAKSVMFGVNLTF